MKIVLRSKIGLYLLILYKSFSGSIEVLLGLFILISKYAFEFISPKLVIKAITYKELVEDPNDFVANWLLAQNPVGLFHPSVPLGLLLISLGIIKLIIALSLILKSNKIRVFATSILSIVIILGVWDIFTNFSIFKLGIILIDIYVLYYLVFLLPKHIQR